MHPHYLIGIDEAGRGPLAGPLCVGACAAKRSRIHDVWRLFGGARECKQLTPDERAQWLSVIRDGEERGVVRVATAFISHTTIDTRGMAYALRVGVARVLDKLAITPVHCRVLLDGTLVAPRAFTHQETIIGGDERELLIALASIAAKTRRDTHMEALAHRFPTYGFDIHKGYGTPAHYAALRRFGPSSIHRMSFLPE